MQIGIELNGVLRDTLKKIEEVYVKWYIDNPITDDDDFDRKVISSLNSLNIREHLTFKNDDELYDFLYVDFPMEIFGHSGSMEYNSFNDLNELYLNYRDYHDFIIISEEIGKSKPSSLFFLSKFGSLIESVIFYSELRLDRLWDNVDILVTANPKILESIPNGKRVIKYSTPYNEHILNLESINKIKDLKEFL